MAICGATTITAVITSACVTANTVHYILRALYTILMLIVTEISTDDLEHLVLNTTTFGVI